MVRKEATLGLVAQLIMLRDEVAMQSSPQIVSALISNLEA
jgi:hypothetical protein